MNPVLSRMYTSLHRRDYSLFFPVVWLSVYFRPMCPILRRPPCCPPDSERNTDPTRSGPRVLIPAQGDALSAWRYSRAYGFHYRFSGTQTSPYIQVLSLQNPCLRPLYHQKGSDNGGRYGRHHIPIVDRAHCRKSFPVNPFLIRNR